MNLTSKTMSRWVRIYGVTALLILTFPSFGQAPDTSALQKKLQEANRASTKAQDDYNMGLASTYLSSEKGLKEYQEIQEKLFELQKCHAAGKEFDFSWKAEDKAKMLKAGAGTAGVSYIFALLTSEAGTFKQALAYTNPLKRVNGKLVIKHAALKYGGIVVTTLVIAEGILYWESMSGTKTEFLTLVPITEIDQESFKANLLQYLIKQAWKHEDLSLKGVISLFNAVECD